MFLLFSLGNLLARLQFSVSYSLRAPPPPPPEHTRAQGSLVRCLLSVPGYVLFATHPRVRHWVVGSWLFRCVEGLNDPPPPSLHCPRPADVTADYYIYNTDTSIPGVGMSAQQSGGVLTQSHTNYGFMTNNPQVGRLARLSVRPCLCVLFVCGLFGAGWVCVLDVIGLSEDCVKAVLVLCGPP